MTDEELRQLVAQNAQAIAAIDRRLEAITRQSESTQHQLNLLATQTQFLAQQQAAFEARQSAFDHRLIELERLQHGIYDIMRTAAQEQAERSKLIDQQIQALIDAQRRKS